MRPIVPADLLQRAGAEVVLAALGNERAVTGRCAVTLQADAWLASFPTAAAFDLLLLPGGPGGRFRR